MKHRWAVGLVCAWLSFSIGLRADDVESLHVFQVQVGLTKTLALQLQARVRTFENISALNQLRAGPVFLWSATPRLTAIGGYYYTGQHVRVVHRGYDIHRFFGGGQYRLVQSEQWTLDGRVAVERFVSGTIPDYWRARSRLLAIRRTPIGNLVAGGEALVQQGVWYGRYSSGLQWNLPHRTGMGVGYEFRQNPFGRPSHVVTTLFQWDASGTRR